MQSVRKLVLIAAGLVGLLTLMAGPALAEPIVGKNGKPRPHGCGRGVKGQTVPPHQTHKHVHVGEHHGDVHAREKHFHDHPCAHYPPKPAKPGKGKNKARALGPYEFRGFHHDRPERDGIPAGIVILGGLGLVTALIGTRLVRRRLD
ncbi:MAG: hypothetical protein M3N24_04370 [Actinomycetota bacterium]|nr:hypothetical protein [Actinomycetota bacterium]